MPKKEIGISETKDGRLSLQLELTDGQKKQLSEFVGATCSANLEAEVTFESDSGLIAPSTFLVGNAV